MGSDRRSRLLAAAAALLVVAAGLWWLQEREEHPAAGVDAGTSSLARTQRRAVSFDEEGEEQTPAESDGRGELRVTVTAKGAPLKDAFVRVYQREPREGADEPSFKVAAEETSGADGQVTFELRRRQYVVIVRAAGLAQAHRQARLLGERLELAVELEDAGRLRGRFVHADSGKPAAHVGFSVAHVRGFDAERLPELPADERLGADADDQGRFELGPLGRGLHALTVESEGYTRKSHELVMPREAELVIKVYRSAWLEGVVVDGERRPVPGATVQATAGRESPARGTTDGEGRFRLEVAPGSHWLSAFSGERSMTSRLPVSVAPAATTRGLELRLLSAAGLEGTVTDESGAPVPVATVRVRRSDDEGELFQRVRTGEDGRWSLGGLAPGVYSVTAGATLHTEARSGQLALLDGQTRTVDLKLSSAGRITGTVVEADGQPAFGVRVLAQPEQPSDGIYFLANRDLTDGRGEFTIKDLAPGDYQVRTFGDRAIGSANATVRAGEVATVKIQLGASGTVLGRVRLASGAVPSEPLAAIVQNPEEVKPRRRPRLEPPVRTPVRADGTFELDAPAGPVRVSVIPAGSFRLRDRGVSLDAVVEAGKTVELDFQWPEEPPPGPSLVSGVVLDARGAPAPGAVLSVRAGRTRLASGVRASDDGSFEIGAPPEPVTGPLEVTARKDQLRAELEDVRPGARDLRLLLGGIGFISGRVQSTRTIAAFTLDAEVEKGPGVARELAFTGDRFELRNVPASRVKLKLATDDGRSGFATVEVRPDEVTEVVVELQSAGLVTGRLVGGGKPLPGELVTLRALPDGQHERERTGRDGSFSFSGVLAGRYLLRVHAEAGGVQRELDLTSGEQLALGDVEVQGTAVGRIGVMLDESKGAVLIRQLVKGSPAEAAGLQVGDVLLAVDGTPVKNTDQASDLIVGPPGTTVRLDIRRSGGTSSVTVKRGQ